MCLNCEMAERMAHALIEVPRGEAKMIGHILMCGCKAGAKAYRENDPEEYSEDDKQRMAAEMYAEALTIAQAAGPEAVGSAIAHAQSLADQLRTVAVILIRRAVLLGADPSHFVN